MKIRSLVLGSVAAAGLSTAGYAADLGVLTSLDVCDSLGLSGLTISSDTNCLQISGGVEYEFKWGNYAPGALLVNTAKGGGAGINAFNVANDGVNPNDATKDNDWESKLKAWVKFVGTASSDFGPASAVIKLQQKQYALVTNEGWGTGTGPAGTDAASAASGSANAGVVLDEAYVSIGDTTVIMAGKKGSIMKKGNDEPLNFLGLFNSEAVDKGVNWGVGTIGDGGHVIQIASDLGNGVSVAGGLEKLEGTNASTAGTAVGVISYAGDGIAAHLTVAAGGILDGVVNNWGYHAGFAGTFDMFKIVAAIAGDDTGYWNGLASAAATFDMFTLAASVEAANTTAGQDYGFGVSGSAAVTDTVTINLGGRWYRDAGGAGGPADAYQIAAQLVAAVTETITLTGEVGIYDTTLNTDADTFYGAATVAWAPGGGFTTSLKGEAYSNGAYRATFKAAKSFQ